MTKIPTDVLARMGAGLTSIATLAWLLWPEKNWQFEAEPALAFGTSLLIWLTTEVRSLFHCSDHPHDVEFVRKVRSQISLDDVRYLEQQDFGASYDNERLTGFWHVEFDSQGKGYGPHDKLLAKRFESFRIKLRELSILLATHGGPIGHSSRVASIIPDQERRMDKFSNETVELVEKVNKLADEVVESFDAFIRASRDRVPSAFGPLGPNNTD